MAAPSTPADKTDDHRQALPAGTRFGELEILRTLGIGGFGIVYLARDHALEREVAIKEFMPAHLAWRSADAHVSVRASSSFKTFEAGRRSFVNEARLLARFDHRSLLKVYRFWEANGTAYMAMPYLQGQTLTKARKDMGHAPDEAWIRQRLLPLLDALALLHSEGVYHRDIAPDNIWLSAVDGSPVLLDFGAARREMGDQTQGFTAILKPSYAPIEQYAESNALRQGPWTDLYALGAVLYHLLTGDAPPPATARVVADECQPLAQRETQALKAYSPSLLQAIDWAMAVRPKERPGSVAEFKAVLLGQATAPARPVWEAPPLERLHPLMNLATATDAEATTVRQDRTAAPESAAAEPADPPLPDRLAVTVAQAEPSTATWPQGAAASAPPAPRKKREPRPATVAAGSPARPRSWGLVAGASLVGVGLLVALAQVLGGRSGRAVGASGPDVAQAGSAAAAPASLASVPMLTPLQAASAVLAAAPPVVAAPAVAAPVLPRPSVRAPAPEPKPAASKPLMPVPSAPSPAPAVVAAPEPAPAEPTPADPVADCADRSNFLSREFCVARRCERPQYEKHPVCVRLQELRDQRRERRH